MEVGGTLQDSVMSYQLMHMYTALQCRHSGGFTLTFKTELHTLFERGYTSKYDYFCIVNPPGCHVGPHTCMTLAVPEFHMKWKIPVSLCRPHIFFQLLANPPVTSTIPTQSQYASQYAHTRNPSLSVEASSNSSLGHIYTHKP